MSASEASLLLWNQSEFEVVCLETTRLGQRSHALKAMHTTRAHARTFACSRSPVMRRLLGTDQMWAAGLYFRSSNHPTHTCMPHPSPTRHSTSYTAREQST